MGTWLQTRRRHEESDLPHARTILPPRMAAHCRWSAESHARHCHLSQRCRSASVHSRPRHKSAGACHTWRERRCTDEGAPELSKALTITPSAPTDVTPIRQHPDRMTPQERAADEANARRGIGIPQAAIAARPRATSSLSPKFVGGDTIPRDARPLDRHLVGDHLRRPYRSGYRDQRIELPDAADARRAILGISDPDNGDGVNLMVRL